jgi:hypothetical protein
MVFILILCLVFTPERAMAGSGKWEEVSRGIMGRILCVEGVKGQDVVYAGTEDGLYKTTDAGSSWERVDFPQNVTGVKRIAVTSTNVFIACESGVYVKRYGADWEWLPGRKDVSGVVAPLEQGADAVAFVWSGKELFRVKGRTWEKISSGRVWAEMIDDAACRSGSIFVASAGKIYRSSDGGKSWQKIFLLKDYGSREEASLEYAGEEAEKELSVIGNIDSFGPEGIVVSTIWGIFMVSDEGHVQKRIDATGLPSTSVKCAAYIEEGIFAATDKDVFRYSDKDERWKFVFGKIFPGSISCLRGHVDSKGHDWLWAAGGRYLYKGDPGSPVSEQGRFGAEGMAQGAGSVEIREVPMREVHRMAINYAEVSPRKIERWRTGAKWKAIMPRLSVGFSESFDDNFDIYKSSSTSYVIQGPRERDNDWGVNLTWELSNLVWNGAQTIIDVRSKLMVQLRDNILEEVTRLYFERKRLLLEIARLEKGSRDNEDRSGPFPAKLLEKKIRVEELTAYIDAYTGGRYSEALRADIAE